ncbi:hypothetical protein AQUCO_00900946v1 [Aquilegia coerulea]|uniref:Splicing factor YJU2 n=1 Tax=Aquilegia coerulea TaxID=218851 RepID=A0A2G5EG37_AQUCA|nr:hypothetical protein AQUCO_00900946v1 [Aquilegia coerulea]
MGERKVVNKYFPPDFDSLKISRRKQAKKNGYGQMKVRMMLPMGIRCNTCRNYMNQGTKINSRIEQDSKITYLGIKIYRLYFKCSNCSSQVIIRTDPKNSDYLVETGATRNREGCCEGENKRKRDDEVIMGSLESIEMRRMKSAREIGLIDALEELKSIKSLQAGLSSDDILDSLMRCTKDKDEDEEEAIIKSIFQEPSNFTHRIVDEDDEDEDKEPHSRRMKHGSKDLPRFSFKSSSSPVIARVSFVKKHCPSTQQLSDCNSALQALGYDYDSDGD